MDNRSLIFRNLINGVPVDRVARDFQLSESEVMNTFSSVFRMIKSYCFVGARGYRKKGDPVASVHAYPIVVGSTVEDARKHKLTCLHVLEKLKLDSAPKYKDIQGEIINQDNIMTVARNL
jgi:hypothetical protein